MVDWKAFWQVEGKGELRRTKDYMKKHISIARDVEKVIKKHGYRSILDFGCGPAVQLKWLAKKYPEKQFTGYDVSRHIINENKKTKLKNLNLKVADLNKMPLKKFYLVLCLSTLHYFSNPLQKIKELLGLVRDKGSLIVNYPSKEGLEFYTRYRKDDLEYWRNRLKLMFKKKNLITLKQIKDLGYECIVIREKKPGNKYVQILKSH